MEEGKEYTMTYIMQFMKENLFTYSNSYGPYLIGEKFMVYKHDEKDLTISFVLYSETAKDAYYKCIYSDLKLKSNV